MISATQLQEIHNAEQLVRTSDADVIIRYQCTSCAVTPACILSVGFESGHNLNDKPTICPYGITLPSYPVWQEVDSEPTDKERLDWCDAQHIEYLEALLCCYNISEAKQTFREAIDQAMKEEKE